MNFLSSGMFGHSAFLRAYHALPIPSERRAAAVARWLDVSPRTVKDWLSGHHCPPRAAVYACWLESTDGRAAVALQLHNEAAAHAAHARSLSDVVQGMGATIDALRREVAELKARRPGADTAANDGAFNDVPRPPHRPQAPASHRPRPLANWRQLV